MVTGGSTVADQSNWVEGREKLEGQFRGAASVSVIICAFTEQRWDELERAVRCVSEQSPAPDEIILVIDHNPQLLERAEQAFLNMKVIPNREIRGLSGARNSGVKASRGDILVFMDEDAWPEPGWLEKLLSAYQDERVLGVGGSILPDWEAGRPAWFPEEFDWVVGCTYRGMPSQTSPVRNLIGANMSFQRSVFLKTEGFKQGIGRVGRFPAGGEETEFSIRARQSAPGGELLYFPSARVHHRVPLSRSKKSYFAYRCYAEGLSKALVTQMVGPRDGLGTERVYTLRTLPLGVLRGLWQVLRGDTNGLQRSLAIISGLVLTIAGYLVGKIKLVGARKILPEHLADDQSIQQQDLPQQSEGERKVTTETIRGE
jgi:GT2 family glycosyltransferase